MVFVKDLEEIVCLSVDSDKNINYDELRKHAKIPMINVKSQLLSKE